MISRVLALFTLAIVLTACASAPPKIRIRPTKLPNGDRGLLVQQCDSRDACVTYAREKGCGSGKFHIRKEQEEKLFGGRMGYAIAIEGAP